MYLFVGCLQISSLRHHSYIPSSLATILYGGVGFLALLLIRSLWHDWQKEKQAREALIEKLHQEGREVVLPQMNRGKKIWNWVLIVYGAAGLLGGLYEIIVHMLGRAR